ATCGSVHISEPKSYINGNAMALDEMSDKVDIGYLYFFFLKRGFNDAISGSAQPQITRQGLSDIQIPLPPLSEQKRIAVILDKADALRRKDDELLKKYDELAQSIFIDMFGDPVKNEKGWEVKKLGEICTKITDGTHDTPARLRSGIKFITGKHIRPYLIDYDNSDYVTEEVHSEIYRRCNPEFRDILYTNIGVNYATAAMNIVTYEFSMKNVALLKYNRSLVYGRYLEYLLNNEHFKNVLRKQTDIGGAQQFLSLGQINFISIPIPSLELQKRFEDKIEFIINIKNKSIPVQDYGKMLFQSLLQQAFKGEL
ncbi:MAG TPA: restriction endonuclease subunit S, partial [Spirochaetota bacterium]|nr:restriction endonuclease subunit S [Spirochaetota bacterium]